jgi:hypothetical protein
LKIFSIAIGAGNSLALMITLPDIRKWQERSEALCLL